MGGQNYTEPKIEDIKKVLDEDNKNMMDDADKTFKISGVCASGCDEHGRNIHQGRIYPFPKDEVLKSEGIKPEGFDDLPVVEGTPDMIPVKHECFCAHEQNNECKCEESHNEQPDSCGCGHDHSTHKHEHHEPQKWSTMKYATIDWGDLNVRRILFSLLTQTFNRYGVVRDNKLFFGGTLSYVNEYKKPNPDFTKTDKIKVSRMMFDNKHRGIKFSFDLTPTLDFVVHNGNSRNIFRLLMQSFDKPFRTIVDEQMKAQELAKKADEVIQPPVEPITEAVK